MGIQHRGQLLPWFDDETYFGFRYALAQVLLLPPPQYDSNAIACPRHILGQLALYEIAFHIHFLCGNKHIVHAHMSFLETNRPFLFGFLQLSRGQLERQCLWFRDINPDRYLPLYDLLH